MHSQKAYLERRSTEELKGLLLAYCEGYAEFTAEAALQICEILSDRNPGLSDPKAEFIRMCLRYVI